MDLSALKSIINRIQGCTFASLDAETSPSPGVRKVTTGVRVVLFTNKKSSGYENMVRRRLERLGKNPDDFVLGDLPWGERIPDTPLIVQGEKTYLQTIVLDDGKSEYFIGQNKVDGDALGLRPRVSGQPLPVDKQVVVATYLIDNIKNIRLMSTEVGE